MSNQIKQQRTDGSAGQEMEKGRIVSEISQKQGSGAAHGQIPGSLMHGLKPASFRTARPHSLA